MSFYCIQLDGLRYFVKISFWISKLPELVSTLIIIQAQWGLEAEEEAFMKLPSINIAHETFATRVTAVETFILRLLSMKLVIPTSACRRSFESVTWISVWAISKVWSAPGCILYGVLSHTRPYNSQLHIFRGWNTEFVVKGASYSEIKYPWG